MQRCRSRATYAKKRGAVHAMAESKIEPNPKKMRWAAAILLNPAAHTKELVGRLWPAFDFFFPLSSVLGLWIGVYCLWNPDALRWSG